MSRARSLADFVTNVLGLGGSAAQARAGLNLRRERFDLAGLTSKDWTVPSGAKAMRLEAHLSHAEATQAYPQINVAVGGPIQIGASDYAFGLFNANSNATFGNGNGNGAGVFFGQHGHGTQNGRMRGSLSCFLDRATTSDYFTFHGEGNYIVSGVPTFTKSYGSLGLTPSGSALRLTDFRISKIGGTAWAAGSHVWVDWLD